jgi:tRNA threonylcarbamoyladenosine biosynthesis protein TsaB
MIVLALDTTTRRGSVALLRAGDVLAERVGNPSVPHGRRLPGDILATVSDAGLMLSEIELYAVASGPGAFTGLRIGIATIQGLAFAHARPVAPVSALDALAHATLPRSEAVPGALIATWMDAARGEVFTALYEVAHVGRLKAAPMYEGADPMHEGAQGSEPMLVEIDPPAVGSADATLARWRTQLHDRRVLFVGDGALTYADSIHASIGAAYVVPSTPALASTIARIALRRAAVGEIGPPHAVKPLYVRRPDAEIAREQQEARPRPA